MFSEYSVHFFGEMSFSEIKDRPESFLVSLSFNEKLLQF